MSEENDNQPPAQTEAPADRPRRPRRRFSRRHGGGRDRGPQEPLGDYSPGDRAETATSDEMSGAPRVNEGDHGDDSQRAEGGTSQNGEIEREPEFGDGIIEISGKGFGFLRDAKRN